MLLEMIPDARNYVETSQFIQGMSQSSKAKHERNS